MDQSGSSPGPRTPWPDLDAAAWARAALDAGVAVQPGQLFGFDGRPRPYLRLGFGRHDERELREAVRRLAAARPAAAPRRRSATLAVTPPRRPTRTPPRGRGRGSPPR